MAISDLIEKIGRTIFEAPFGSMQISKNAPELAEIRLAVLDEVKAKSHRVSGKDVFPVQPRAGSHPRRAQAAGSGF